MRYFWGLPFLCIYLGCAGSSLLYAAFSLDYVTGTILWIEVHGLLLLQSIGLSGCWLEASVVPEVRGVSWTRDWMVSPALAGGFPAPRPPGKSLDH